jgi:hypothetical protein
LKRLALKDFDFSCHTPSKVINMNTAKTGDIGSHFIVYTTQINRKLVGESFGATEFLKDTTSEALDVFAKYPESLVCKEK